VKFIKKYKYILLIFLVCSIILFKLFTETRYFGHDTAFHVGNIVSLAKTISWKNWFGDNLLTFGSNLFGYGTYLFYPKLPHLLGAYLYLIFDNIYLSMNVIYFIVAFLSSLVVYLFSFKVFKDKKVALISALVYLTIPYHVGEMYVRDAFAENFMFLAFPLIFYGLYNLKNKCDKSFYIPFILGYLIGMYSHLISMVFCTIFVLIYLVYNYKVFLKKDKIWGLLVSTLIVSVICLPYLVNMIEHRMLDIYTVFLGNEFTNEHRILASVVKLGDFVGHRPYDDKIMVYLGYPIIILFVATTVRFFINKKMQYKKEGRFLLVVLLLFVVLLCSNVIWQNVPSILWMIQFVWRLIVPFSLIVALYVPLVFLNLNINQILKRVLIISCVIFLVFEGFINIFYYGNYQYKINEVLNMQYVMGWQREYLPYVTNHSYKGSLRYVYFEMREYGIESLGEDVDVEILYDHFPNMSFKVSGIDDKVSLEFPRIYYLGYHLYDSDDEMIDLYYDKYGYLATDISEDGEYRIVYTGTLLYYITKVIRFIFISFLLIYGVVRWFKWKKRRK